MVFLELSLRSIAECWNYHFFVKIQAGENDLPISVAEFKL